MCPVRRRIVNRHNKCITWYHRHLLKTTAALIHYHSGHSTQHPPHSRQTVYRSTPCTNRARSGSLQICPAYYYRNDSSQFLIRELELSSSHIHNINIIMQVWPIPSCVGAVTGTLLWYIGYGSFHYFCYWKRKNTSV